MSMYNNIDSIMDNLSHIKKETLPCVSFNYIKGLV